MTTETLEQPATHIPPMTETDEASKHTVAVVWENGMTDNETFDTQDKAAKYYDAAIKQRSVLFCVMIQNEGEESSIIASYQSAKLKGH